MINIFYLLKVGDKPILPSLIVNDIFYSIKEMRLIKLDKIENIF